MDHDSKKRLVRDFLEGFATAEPEALLARMTATPSWSVFAHAYSGRDGLLTLRGLAAQLYPNGTAREYHRQYVDGDTVISQLTVRATLADGQPYENRYAIFVHFEGDKVARVEEYLDTAYANKRFGLEA